MSQKGEFCEFCGSGGECAVCGRGKPELTGQEVDRVLAEARAWAGARKTEGWTREDFLAKLAEILGVKA